MIKMKKSALAAAVLLSVMTMGVEAAVTEPIEVVSGDAPVEIHESVNIIADTSNGIHFISSDGTESQQILFTIAPSDDGDIVVLATGTHVLADGTTRKPYNALSLGDRYLLDNPDYQKAVYNTIVNLDAETIDLKATGGKFACGVIMHNPNDDSCEININQNSEYAQTGHVIIGGKCDVYDDRLSGMYLSGGITRIDGKTIDIISDSCGIYIENDAKLYIGQKNFDSTVRIGGYTGTGSVYTYGFEFYGKADIKIDGADITIHGQNYGFDINGTYSSVCINQNLGNDKFDKVLIEGRNNINGGSQVSIKGKTIVFGCGGAKEDRSGIDISGSGTNLLLEGNDIYICFVNDSYKTSSDQDEKGLSVGVGATVLVKAFSGSDANVNIVKYDKVTPIAIKNAGTISLDGNGQAINWVSGEIAGTTGILDINGKVIMRTPSVANKLNVTDGAVLRLKGKDNAVTLSNTFDVADSGQMIVDTGVTASIDADYVTDELTNKGTVSVTADGKDINGKDATSNGKNIDNMVGKISGGNVTLADGVHFNGSNLDNGVALTSNGAFYDFSIDLSTATPAIANTDVISVKTATGTVKLGNVNITGVDESATPWTGTKSITFLTADGSNELTIDGSLTKLYMGYKYKFEQGTNNGDMAVTKVDGSAYTLAKIIKDTDSCGNVDVYELTGQTTELDGFNKDNSTAFTRVIAGSARTFTIDGGNKTQSFVGSDGKDGNYKGISMATADTLNLTNIDEISGWNGDVVTNNNASGNVNISNVNLLDSGVTNNGTMVISDVAVIGANATITNNTKNSKLNINGLTGEKATVLNGAIADATNKAGTTTLVTGNLNVNGNITQKTFTTNTGTNMVVDDEATLTITTLTNNGVATFESAATLKNITNSKGSGKYIVKGGTFAKEFVGTATSTNLILDNDFISDYKLTAKITVNEGKSLTIGAGNINGAVTNNGTLTMKDGNLVKAVSGTGNTVVDGTVTATAAISNDVTINEGKSLSTTAALNNPVTNEGTLTVSAANLKKGVTNTKDAIVNLNAGTLASKVDGGTLNVNADVSSKMEYIAANSVNVADDKTLTFTDGGIFTKNIDGAQGKVKFTVDTVIDSPVVIAGNVQFAGSSTLTVDGQKITETAAISNVAGATVEEGAKLYINNVETDKIYKVLSGTGIDIDEAWVQGVVGLTPVVNIASGSAYDVTFVVDEDFADKIDLPNVYEKAMTDADSTVYKWVDKVDTATGGDVEATANAINTVANMSAVAGVQSGTASMVNSMANNLASNLGSSARPNMMSGNKGGLRNTATDNGEVKIDTVEVGKAANVMPERYLAKAYNKEVWASYIYSKQHVDGLKAGMLDSKSVNQYNGVTVGADLWSGKHSFGGVALSYADGNVNAGNLRNDTDYYGVSIYNRHDYKGLTMLTDVSYTHSKNDINISGTQEITADAKADAIGVGVRFETPVTMGKTTVTPYAGARYTYLKNKDYDNNLGMNYDTDNQNLVTIPVGLEISAEFAMPESDWTFRPVLEGGYVWNLGDRDGNTKIGYMGAYDIVGFETSDPGQYFIRAAMQFATENFTCEFGYRYSKGKSVRDNRWNVNLNYMF